MKPAPFAYHRPRSREEIDRVLAEYGEDAKILAGGQSLIPILNMRLAAPDHLVDINHLAGEDAEPRLDDGRVVFGPLVRQVTAEESAVVAERAPLLREALAYVAHPAIRSRGTIVGSIAHGDPAAELPAVLVLLEGEVRLRRDGATRVVPAAEFFVAPLHCAVEPGEWVEQVAVPVSGTGQGSAFEEYAQRSGDYALCGVAATAETAGDDGVRVHLAFLGMGEVPQRLSLEPLARGDLDGDGLVDVVATLTGDALEPTPDLHASVEYRMWLARRLAVRAARRAAARLATTPTEGA